MLGSGDGLGRLATRTWPDGRSPSLRWILCHMIEEYARHNGHADLLRESIDGARRRVTLCLGQSQSLSVTALLSVHEAALAAVSVRNSAPRSKVSPVGVAR